MGTNEENEIYEKIKDIVAEVLDVDKEIITPDSRYIEDLGAESLDMNLLLMEMEEQFSDRGKISEDEVLNLRTVGDTLRLITNKKTG